MTRTPDERALLAAVIAEPACDAARLVFADRLQENAGKVACGCDNGSQDTGGSTPWGEPINERCQYCSGSGVVSDGREAWAEFIRVQVELADGSQCPAWCDPNDETCERRILERRERELFDRHRAEWFPYAGVKVTCDASVWPALSPPNTATHTIALVRRGLVERVVGSLESLRGAACGDCGGTGMSEREYQGVIDDDGGCGKCHGAGRIGGVLMALAGSQPVEVATATCRKPWADPDGTSAWFGRTNEDTGQPLDALPESLWERLKGWQSARYNVKWYPTEAAALAALSRVMLAEARDDAAKLASVLA